MENEQNINNNERLCSVKVSKTSTGKYSYECKLYFDLNLDPEGERILGQIKEIESKLDRLYGKDGGKKQREMAKDETKIS